MKGLLVTPDLLRAYAEGRKTVTRRLTGLNKINLEPAVWELKGQDLFWSLLDKMAFIFQKTDGQELIIKPRYQVGEMVYLKEVWASDVVWDNYPPSVIEAQVAANVWYQYDDILIDSPASSKRGRWRSPISMPAWAARHFQRIVSVRPERLQEISLEDCLAEGIVRQTDKDNNIFWYEVSGQYHGNTQGVTSKDSYTKLWDVLYPKYPWAISPWVWRTESERAERP